MIQQEIQNVLEYRYANYTTEKHYSGNQQSLLARTGDLAKNSLALKTALSSIQYPHSIDQEQLQQGYPADFLKMLHFTLFHCSSCVCQHLFSSGVDPDTLLLPDNQFLARVLFILPNYFQYRPKLALEQFFKYGFSESKILLVIDVINLVKRKHKYLNVRKQLDRPHSTRSLQLQQSLPAKTVDMSVFKQNSRSDQTNLNLGHTFGSPAKQENIDIRIVGPFDNSSPLYPQTLQLRNEILRKPLGMNLYNEDLSSEKDQLIWAVLCQDEVIGNVMAFKFEGTTCRIRQMCVSEKYQGMRVGQRLADFALAHLRSIGVELVTAHARESALPFYLKQGWQTVGNRYTEVGIPHFSIEKRIAGTALKKPAADLNCHFCRPTNRASTRPLTRSPKRAAYDQPPTMIKAANRHSSVKRPVTAVKAKFDGKVTFAAPHSVSKPIVYQEPAKATQKKSYKATHKTQQAAADPKIMEELANSILMLTKQFENLQMQVLTKVTTIEQSYKTLESKQFESPSRGCSFEGKIERLSNTAERYKKIQEYQQNTTEYVPLRT